MSEKPRLVIDGRRLSGKRTGVGRYLETLLNQWAETSWPEFETLLIVQDESALARVPDHPRLTVRTIGSRWPGLIWEMFGLRRFLRACDLLFAPTNLIPPNWRGRTVLVVFDTLLENCPQGFSWLVRLRFRQRYRAAARRATRIVVPSIATREDVANFYKIDPSRIEVIYPSIDSHFAPVSKTQIESAAKTVGIDGNPYFIFVGKPSARRHLSEIIDAFTRFHAKHPKARLLFVGPESDSIPTASGIIHAGHVGEDVLVGLLSGALGCLYPSDSEGFGLPVAEAMACGCPVVTLRRSALVESGGDAAFYLEEPSVGEIERAMHALYDDENLRARHRKLGLAHARRFQGNGFAEAVKAAIEAEGGLAVTQSGRVV